ncbi:MAG: hypothetical protein ACRCWQ_11010 [Bacilli bacterium]
MRFETVADFMRHLEQKRDATNCVYRIYSDEGDVVATNNLKRLALWGRWNIAEINCTITNNRITTYKIFVG